MQNPGFDDDLYAVLGVSPDAPAEEIKRAYRSRIRSAHPDTNPDPDAQETSKMLNRAYEVLGNPQRRSEYDAFLGHRQQAAEQARQEESEQAARQSAEQAWMDMLAELAEMAARAEAERQRRAHQAEAAARAEAGRRARAAQASAARASAPRQRPAAPSPSHAAAADPAPGRGRSWLAAGAVIALIAVLGGIFLLRDRGQPLAEEPAPAPAPSPSDSPAETTAPAQPFVTVADSTDPLVVQSVADQDAVLDLPTGTWVPQVSSKCAGLTRADLLDAATGRSGYPDGTPEPYEKGLTEAQITAFHEVLADRFDDVLLISEGASEGPCAGRTTWASLVAEPAASAAGADSWCDAAGLPDAECDPRAVDESLLGKARFQEMVVSTQSGDTTVLAPSDATITVKEHSAEFIRDDGGLAVMVYDRTLGQELPSYQEWEATVTQEFSAPTYAQEFGAGRFRLSSTYDSNGVASIYYLGSLARDSGAIVLLWFYPASQQEVWGAAIERGVAALEAG